MRRKLGYIVFIISLGCNTIDNLEPNQTDTFLKFYSETNEMNSKDLAVLEDGYLIMSTYTETSTLLLRTDTQGNKVWAKSFDNFLGSSLTVIVDSDISGYILIGDRINTQNDSTYMQLIKTDVNGDSIASAQVGYGAQHGSAVTYSSTKEIIGLGYTSSGQLNDTNDSTYIIVTGFDQNLVQTWQQVRSEPVLNVDITPSKSIFEDANGNLSYISYSSQDEVFTNINFTNKPPDSESPAGNSPLFTANSVSNNMGDFIKIPTGYAIAQSVLVSGASKIGISNGSNDTILVEGDFAEGNFIASAIVSSSNGLLIAATTDNHGIESARTDQDLLLIETNYNGTLKSDGINKMYGGIGDEIPVRIRRANDGGYIVLGTSINSKGAQQSFLLKTNSKGELN